MNSIQQINDDISVVDENGTNDDVERRSNHRSNYHLSRDSPDPEEELTRILTTENRQQAKNLVVYSYRDKQFVPLAQQEQGIVHYSYEGNLIPIDSEEAKIYLQKEKSHGFPLSPMLFFGLDEKKETKNIDTKQIDEHFDRNFERMDKSFVDFSTVQVSDDEERQTVTSDITETSEIPEELSPIAPTQSSTSLDKPKKILNRFNFCEQGIQTSSSSKKVVTTLTDPIVRKRFVGLANQRIIYQEYQNDYEKQQKDKDKRKQKVNYGSTKGILEKKLVQTDRLKPDVVLKRRQVQILKSIERVLNQNRYDELIHDFKYFEDKTDEIRDPLGSLFPLWKFPSAFPDRSVTALTWSPTYSDMLIIGYGLYDRAKRSEGTIAMFTLNNSHPETLIQTESTVLSMDCSPSKPYLVCVGLMDGDVIVYDLSVPSGKALFINRSYTCKHLDCVWQVRWCDSSIDHYPRFCSAGADGQIMRWTCRRGQLRQVLLLTLPSATKPKRLDDGTLLTLKGPAISLDFHRQRKDLFLVGTEDGKIYKASVNDPGMIETTYDAHDFAVYAVQWSPFHPNIFASCSADGTVKIWHEKILQELMRFDLCTSLQDFGWSPHTSTTFAVAGADGKVYFFDIHANKLEPICEQSPSTKCTKLAFHPSHPILLVGDESGSSMCLKLSANLRKKAKIRKGLDLPVNSDPEFDKLVQELAQTVAGDSMIDILSVRPTEIDD